MKVIDESTIILNKENEAEKTKPQATTEKDNPGIAWKSVLVGGIPGLLLGTVGTVFATPNHNQKDSEEIKSLKEEVADLKETVEDLQEQVNVTNHHSSVPPIGDSVAVAHGVSDDMSFSDAFAAARSEVGPGGVFIWHGNVYGTYYASEWNNMSDAEKHEYANAVRHTDYDTSVAEASHESHYHETSYDEGDIHVLGQETVETEDGDLIQVARVEIDGHYGEIYDVNNDGQPDMALIDTNDDGYPDIVMMDENENGTVDPEEVYHLSDEGIIPNVQPEDVLYGEMPDYTNDADVSSLDA